MDKMIEIKTNKDLRSTFAKMNRLKQGAYINFKGVATGTITFHKLFVMLDNKNYKILFYDKIRNDIIKIDKRYISKIERSINNKKLKIQLESDYPEDEVIIVNL